jgi:RND family efflux transporter MFP subunit
MSAHFPRPLAPAREIPLAARVRGALLHAVGLAAALTFVLTLPGCNSDAAAPADAVRPVKTATVKFDSAAHRTSYPGTVQPRHESELAFRVPGRVTKRFVDAGQRVTKGTVLARLDDEDLRLGLRAAEALLASALADAAQSQVDLERYEQIRNSPAFNKAVYDKRRATLEMAVARRDQAMSQLKLKQNELAYGTLVADHEGVVTAIKAEAGQVVAAGQPVIALARAGDLEVKIDVPEQRLGELKKLEGTVTLWSKPGQKFTARLREVAASAEPVTRTYAVRYALEAPQADLRIGMSANVVLERDGGAAGAEVPLTAVFQDHDQPMVWVVDAATGRLTRTPVTVANLRTDTALITAGLKNGDVVVAAGAHRLDESQRVRIMSEVELRQPHL